ncbi:ABC transporter permease [Nocardioides panacisoli]|uniref:ABC transporter permease n=1 Tax=Nocardioides panacisoli TaxID=627624 RepID=UPI0031E3BE77
MIDRLRNDARLLSVGGAISFRALFNWMSPWIYVPSLLLAPIFQILLFAYLGRGAGVGDDQFYVVGNAVQYSAIPCLFAMGQTVAGERQNQTLGLVLTSPAARIPLFVGRSIPVIVNGWITTLVSLLVGGLLLGVTFAPSELAGIALVLLVASASCTGLGLVLAAIDLRVREGAVINNIVFGFLLLFTGANIALSTLPGWMAHVGGVLPLTHAIEASRQLAAGRSLGSVGGLVGKELGIGLVCVLVGLLALRLMEESSRRRATLELL